MVELLDVDVENISVEEDLFDRSERAESNLTVTAIVPVHDDPEGAETTVRSLSAAASDSDQIVVVCTPSSGETLSVVSSLAEEIPQLSVHTEDTHRTPGHARNIGIKHADGDVLAFVDADMTVEPTFFDRLLHAFSKSDVAYLGVSVAMGTDRSEETLFGWYDSKVRFPVRTFMRYTGFCPTCCLAVRRTVVADGLRFDPRLSASEDVVFGRQALDAGYQFGYCSDITVRHPTRESLDEIVAKGKKTGTGWYQRYALRDEEYFVSRSRLLTLRAYLPRSFRYLSEVCDDWGELSTRERVTVWGLASLEKLCVTWGFAAASLGAADDPTGAGANADA